MNSYRERIRLQGYDAAKRPGSCGQWCPYRSGWQRDAWLQGFRDRSGEAMAKRLAEKPEILSEIEHRLRTETPVAFD